MRPILRQPGTMASPFEAMHIPARLSRPEAKESPARIAARRAGSKTARQATQLAWKHQASRRVAFFPAHPPCLLCDSACRRGHAPAASLAVVKRFGRAHSATDAPALSPFFGTSRRPRLNRLSAFFCVRKSLKAASALPFGPYRNRRLRFSDIATYPPLNKSVEDPRGQC